MGMNIDNMNGGRLPVGIQSFQVIREGGYIYVDKTDLIWQLANYGKKYNYLSRPRRFGKSVLVDTLQAYFEGRKELFEGLKIMSLEKQWKRYPILRFDMSLAGATGEELTSYLNVAFRQYEQLYGIEGGEQASLTMRFMGIIDAAYQTTGEPVVVLIDEYDSPLQHSWKTPHHEECTAFVRVSLAQLLGFLRGNLPSAQVCERCGDSPARLRGLPHPAQHLGDVGCDGRRCRAVPLSDGLPHHQVLRGRHLSSGIP